MGGKKAKKQTRERGGASREAPREVQKFSRAHRETLLRLALRSPLYNFYNHKHDFLGVHFQIYLIRNAELTEQALRGGFLSAETEGMISSGIKLQEPEFCIRGRESIDSVVFSIAISVYRVNKQTA